MSQSPLPETIRQLLALLAVAYPHTFFTLPAQRRPLKIGIDRDLLPFLEAHPEFSLRTLRRALRVYTHHAVYRQRLAQGGDRIDLDGTPAGVVTPDQQASASNPRQPPAPPLVKPSLQEIAAMSIPAQLEVTVKFHQLPHAQRNSPATLLFAVQAGDETVFVELKNKHWAKLEAAAQAYPLWVAALTGKLGKRVKEGFFLAEPALQVFEKKPKAATAPPAEPAGPPPVSAKPVEPRQPAITIKKKLGLPPAGSRW